MKPADKFIQYDPHARRRLAQRGVPESQVAQTLRNPDSVRPAKRPDAKRFEKAISRQRRLAVIAVEESASFWVISVWWM
jgi:hypothetical protein